jgi:hypothetical protein
MGTVRAARRTAGRAVALARWGVGLAGLWLAGVSPVHAASPSPTSPIAGDPRSSGAGPGLVGDPVLAILVVAAIAGASIAVTWLYVRATGGSGRSVPPTDRRGPRAS